MKKELVGTLDLEPTWESLYINMLEMHINFMNYTFEQYTQEIRDQHELLLSQFKNMARAADVARQQQKEIYSRNIIVNDMPTTIGLFIKEATDENEIIPLTDEELEILLDMRPGEMITICAMQETIIVRPVN